MLHYYNLLQPIGLVLTHSTHLEELCSQVISTEWNIIYQQDDRSPTSRAFP